LRLTELELIERERRMVERRIAVPWRCPIGAVQVGCEMGAIAVCRVPMP